MDQQQFCKHISKLIKEDQTFLFIIDFEKQKPLIFTLEECEHAGIYYQIGQHTNITKTAPKEIDIEVHAVAKSVYKTAFDKVSDRIGKGDSFLTNLTFPSNINCDATLKDINQSSKALYKLLVDDEFVVFSPESFIKIENNTISTYPMKGTITADIANAEQQLMDNKKEQWEHNTIVDLMRNDLSMVAKHVKVTDFRYISEIQTPRGNILQTSSKIEGQLNQGWENNFGEMLLKLLPAGSICGAPKDKTVAIIEEAEQQERGFYTGIFGIYNKGQVDSAVAIRYIEKKDNEQLQYRSGGGITFTSNLDDEYDELIKKIYIPS